MLALFTSTSSRSRRQDAIRGTPGYLPRQQLRDLGGFRLCSPRFRLAWRKSQFRLAPFEAMMVKVNNQPVEGSDDASARDNA
jgi:hypothetical protein